jgi:hypothetical protein
LNTLTKTCSATALLILALSGQPAGASETYYRWIGEDGTPVNSDRPPPAGVKYERITTETNTNVADSPDESEQVEGGETATKADRGGSYLPRIVVEKDPEACKIARQNLETLNTHARIRMPDGDGNYRYLNEDEKAAQRAQAEAAIKQNCD